MMFGKPKSAPRVPLHEFVLQLDRLIDVARAGRLDPRDMADLLDVRANALRLAFVTCAPSDASMH
jgi:hypothetical protein